MKKQTVPQGCPDTTDICKENEMPVEGSLDIVKGKINERVKQLLQQFKGVKIGRSFCPQNRFNTDYKNKKYDYYHLIYRSDNEDDTVEIEGYLIEEFWCQILNKTKNSEGRETEEKKNDYYVYAVVMSKLTKEANGIRSDRKLDKDCHQKAIDKEKKDWKGLLGKT